MTIATDDDDDGDNRAGQPGSVNVVQVVREMVPLLISTGNSFKANHTKCATPFRPGQISACRAVGEAEWHKPI